MTERIKFYFDQALAMTNEGWQWNRILNYLNSVNLTHEEVELIKQELNKECKL
jgi:hypothetical protein